MDSLKPFLLFLLTFLFIITILVAIGYFIARILKKHKPNRPKPLEKTVRKDLQESIRLNEENRKSYFAKGMIKQNSPRLQRIIQLNNRYSINDLEFTKECASKKEFDTVDPDSFIISFYLSKTGKLFEACQKVERNRANADEYYKEFDRIASENNTVTINDFSLTREECISIENALIEEEKKKKLRIDFSIRIWIVYSSPQGRTSEKRYKDYNYESIMRLVRPYLKQEEQRNWLNQYYQSLREKEEDFVKLHLSIDPGTELSRVDKMTGVQFEKWCGNFFSVAGYSDVQFTKTTGDFGADLICIQSGEKAVVQCKCFQSALGLKPIQEVIGAIGYYKANKGIVVTNNYFTPSAKQLALETGIQLMDRDYLIKKIGEFKEKPNISLEYVAFEKSVEKETIRPPKDEQSNNNGFSGANEKSRQPENTESDNNVEATGAKGLMNKEESDLGKSIELPQGLYIVGRDFPEGSFVFHGLSDDGYISIEYKDEEDEWIYSPYYFDKNPYCRLFLNTGSKLEIHGRVVAEKAEMPSFD